MSKKRSYFTTSKKSQIAIAAVEGKLTQAQITSEYGVPATQVKSWKQIALQAINDVFSGARDKEKKAQTQFIEDLYQEIGRLQAQLSWLKKSMNLSLDKKRAMIEENAEISIREQCILLELSVSSYYDVASSFSEEDERLMALLDEHYLQYPCEGKIKRAKWLSKEVGYPVGKRRVKKLMEKIGLSTVYPKPNTSVPNKEHEVFPNLLRDVNIIKPNQVWAADTTYIRMKGRHVYLVAIMDWYSRYVLNWAVSPNMEAEFCVEALRNALLLGRCEVFNTD